LGQLLEGSKVRWGSQFFRFLERERIGGTLKGGLNEFGYVGSAGCSYEIGVYGGEKFREKSGQLGAKKNSRASNGNPERGSSFGRLTKAFRRRGENLLERKNANDMSGPIPSLHRRRQ